MKKVSVLFLFFTFAVLQAQVVFETALETAFQKRNSKTNPYSLNILIQIVRYASVWGNCFAKIAK
ncbi:hypothetical protein [Flavobacterium tegetincola]|uniref:hypothetical protein n=1 Tax=Flavobacterium tegetincola TaxID=150172 RepID=UPI000418D5F3|nr:hypothetical protein [Flavobacterium tegetincola]